MLGWVASSSLQVIKIKRQPPYYFDTVHVPISEGNVLNTYHLDISGFSCNERQDNGLLPALSEFYLEYCADLTQEKIEKPLEKFCGQKNRQTRIVTIPWIYDLYQKNEKLIQITKELRSETNQQFSDYSSNMTMLNSMILKLLERATLINVQINELEEMEAFKQPSKLAKIFNLKLSNTVALSYSIVKSCKVDIRRKSFKLELFEPLVVKNKAIVFLETFDTFSSPDNCLVKYDGEHLFVLDKVRESFCALKETYEEIAYANRPIIDTCKEVTTNFQLNFRRNCSIKSNGTETRTQIKNLGGIYRIYCYPETIEINAEPAINCPNFVFQISAFNTLKINGTTIHYVHHDYNEIVSHDVGLNEALKEQIQHIVIHMPEDESLTRHIEMFSNSNGLVSGFKKAYDYIGSGVKSIATAIGDFIGYIKIILLSILAILALCVLLVILCYFYPVFKCLTDQKPKPQKKNQKKQQIKFRSVTLTTAPDYPLEMSKLNKSHESLHPSLDSSLNVRANIGGADKKNSFW